MARCPLSLTCALSVLSLLGERLIFSVYYFIRALNLAFDLFNSASAPNQTPLIIMHGLLGCKRNWQYVARSLSHRGFGKVYCVDARNHGSSPWSNDMSYKSMANDILQFIRNLNVSRASLMGHSMGGKAMMAAALMEPSMVNRLVVVDIAPSTSPNKDGGESFISLMERVDLRERMTKAGNIPTIRANLMKEWEKAIPSYSERAFILSNLVELNGTAAWRVNVRAIHDNMRSIFSFPFSYGLDNITYKGPALFISGGLSPFLTSDHMPCVLHFFPRAKRVEIPTAGHWVNADAPELLIGHITEFLNQ